MRSVLFQQDKGPDHTGGGDTPQTKDKGSHPQTTTRDDCKCALELIPFDCKEKTCECPNVVRSEACGIRYDSKPTDRVWIGYRSRAKAEKGKYEVKRIHPDQLNVASGELDCGKPECQQIEKCLKAFEVLSVPRPAIVQQNQSVTKLGDLLLSKKPELRPYTNREIYRVTLLCDETSDEHCKKEVDITVWDADLILLCYNFAYNQASIDYWGATNPIPADRTSFHQFVCALAENGARALCQKYYESATQCDRPFKNHCWAAGISAVLAEQLYKVFVEGDRTDPVWAEFFNLPDEELTATGVDLTDFEDSSAVFGRAHTRHGVRRAIELLGGNPCCADDLNTIAETLAKAQADLLNQFKTAWGSTVFLGLASVFGQDPQAQFRKSLRKEILKALERLPAEQKCYDSLRALW